MKYSVPQAAFAECMPQPFILFGAGGELSPLYKYLRNGNLDKCITGVVDNDPAKQGKFFLKHKIQSVEWLLQQPAMPILITSPHFAAEMAEQLRAHGLKNPVFWWISYRTFNFIHVEFQFMYQFGNTPLVDDYDTVISMYEDDPYTKALVRFILFCRSTPYGYILPLENISLFDRFAASEEYFQGEQEAILLRYPELTIVDGGAHIGETQNQYFSRHSDRIARYYAIEPDPANFALLKKNTQQAVWRDRSICLPYICDAKSGPRTIATNLNMGSHVTIGKGVSLEARSLDSLDIQVSGKLCIFLDVEGMELATLAGAAGLIKKHRPLLAISAYHRFGDIYDIPAFCKSLIPEYRFVARSGFHTLVYGIAD